MAAANRQRGKETAANSVNFNSSLIVLHEIGESYHWIMYAGTAIDKKLQRLYWKLL